MMIRRFLIVILLLGFSFSASNSFAALLSWRPVYDGGNCNGWFLDLHLPSGDEVVFNELIFEDAHNVTCSGGITNYNFVYDWNSTYITSPVPDDATLFSTLPEIARYDTFMTIPSNFCSSTPKLKEFYPNVVDTNDGTNPGNLNLSYPSGAVAGIGDISADFTVLKDPGSYLLTFAYVTDSALAFHSGPRTYVTLDVTIGENNYRWAHQPIGWIESAYPRLATDPADGKLDFGKVRIGTTEEKSGTILPTPENFHYFSWTPPDGQVGDFQKSNGSDFSYTPSDHGEDREWLGNEFYCWYDDGTNHWGDDGSSVYFDCTGQGVGPVFEGEIALGETIDFGEVAVDSFFDVFFEIGNMTPDEEAGDLTGLSFMAEIVGDDAALFQIMGYSTGTLLVGETTNLWLRFNGSGLFVPDSYDASLIIYTDENTEFGNTVTPNVFAMSATTMVPEPSVWIALLGLGMAAFVFRKKRR